MLRRFLESTLAVCLVLLLAADAVGQNATAPQVSTHAPVAQVAAVLPRDTELEMVLLESVSSATATKGQAVRLAVAKDVVVKGLIVIPRGTPGTGMVARLEKGVPGKRDGYLVVRPVSLTLGGGTNVKLKENRTGEDDCASAGPCWVLFALEAPLLPLIAINALSERNEEKHTGKDITRDACSWPGTEAYVAHRQWVRVIDFNASTPNPGLPECPSKEDEQKSAVAQ